MLDTFTGDQRPTIWIDQTDDVPERFTIDTEDKANWLLGKLAAIEDEQARVKAQARKRAEELEADRNRLMGRFGAELEAFARTLAEQRRRKSVTLLQGTLAFRSVPARLVVTDPAAAFEHAMKVKHLVVEPIIKQEPELSPADYLAFAEKFLVKSGELLPGIERTEAGESFAIRFPKGKGGEEE